MPERVAATPLFFGANPAVVGEGPLAGKRLLADAHRLAVELAKTMNAEQQAKMMLDKKPRDVITGPGREKQFVRGAGVAIDDMKYSQRELFRNLLDSHFANLELTHRYLAEDQSFGTLPIMIDDKAMPIRGQFTFAWAGPIDVDKPFYYRIQYDNYVIEYSCQGKNHVHCVLHDLTDPLQEDLLQRHFEQHEHE